MDLTENELERRFAAQVATIPYPERVRMLYFGPELEDGFAATVPYDTDARAASTHINADSTRELTGETSRWAAIAATGSLSLIGAQHVLVFIANLDLVKFAMPKYR